MNENAPLIIIEYCDDGFGIPTEQKESIFARHYSTRDSGKGLGLYDAWMAINRHRGTIIENGTPGKGARFEITFPTATIE
jgi:signal transduction histidine kinase